MRVSLLARGAILSATLFGFYLGRLDWTIMGPVVGLVLVASILDHLAGDDRNSDSAEIALLLDVAAAATVIAGFKVAETLGVLAAFPVALGGEGLSPRRLRIAASTGLIVLLAGWVDGATWYPSIGVGVQAILSSFCSWLPFLGSKPKSIQSSVEVVDVVETDVLEEDDRLWQLIDLREKYRQLKASFKELEKRGKSDQLKIAVTEWRLSDDPSQRSLAKTLREALGVEGLALYVSPDSRDGFILAGMSGKAPSGLSDIAIPARAATILIREKAEKALKSLRDPEGPEPANVLLLDHGRLAGLLAVFEPNSRDRTDVMALVEEASGFIAKAILDVKDIVSIKRKASQDALLADVALRSDGVRGPEAAKSLVGDLIESLELDGCAIWNLVGETPALLAGGGDDPLVALELGEGPAMIHWAEQSAKEILISDARSDSQCRNPVALRKGIGSIFVAPLESSGLLVGAIVAWKKEAGGLDASRIGAIRSLCPTLIRRVFGGFPTGKPGLVDPETFWASSTGPGNFVEIHLGTARPGVSPETVKVERRKLLAATLSRLPKGGLLTRRDTGTLLAFLPGVDESRAEKWATAIRPFMSEALNMSVERLGGRPQSNQFSDRLTA